MIITLPSSKAPFLRGLSSSSFGVFGDFKSNIPSSTIFNIVTGKVDQKWQ